MNQLARSLATLLATQLLAGALFCFFFGSVARAEDFRKAHGDFFHVFLSDREDLKVRYIFEKDHEEENGGGGEFDLNQLSLDGEVPLEIGDDLYFRMGGGYGARLYDFKSVRGARTALSSETLHRAEMVTGLGWFVSDDVLLTGAARLGVFSDFDAGLESDDFQVHGEVLTVVRFNPGAQVVFGVRESEDFDDTPVLPLIGFRMLSDDGKLQLSLTAPVELRVGYALDPEIELYGRALASGEEYTADAGRLDERFQIHTHDRRFGVGVDVWFGSNVKLGMEAGVAVGSELDFKIEDAGQFSGDLDDAGYFMAGLGFSL